MKCLTALPILYVLLRDSARLCARLEFDVSLAQLENKEGVFLKFSPKTLKITP